MGIADQPPSDRSHATAPSPGRPREAFWDRLAADAVGVLTTRSTGERVTGRPMTFLPGSFDGPLWFICPADAQVLRQIALVSEVQVTFVGDDGWTVAGGKAHQVTRTDVPAAIRRLLDEADDASVGVRVSVLTARHWPASGSWSPDAQSTSADLAAD